MPSTKPKPSMSTPIEPTMLDGLRRSAGRRGRVVAAGGADVADDGVHRLVRILRTQTQDLVVDVGAAPGAGRIGAQDDPAAALSSKAARSR